MHAVIQSSQQSPAGPIAACTHRQTTSVLIPLVQASVETLREQVKLLRSQRQRAVVLAHLPALRAQAQAPAHGKGPSPGCAALDLARRLQLEPAQTPKVGTAAAPHHCVCSSTCAGYRHKKFVLLGRCDRSLCT